MQSMKRGRVQDCRFRHRSIAIACFQINLSPRYNLKVSSPFAERVRAQGGKAMQRHPRQHRLERSLASGSFPRVCSKSSLSLPERVRVRASPWLVAGPSGGWANSLACPKVGSRVPDPNFTRKKDRLLLSFPSGRRIPGVGPSRYEKQCGAGPVHYSQDEKRLGLRSGPVYHPPEEEWRQLPPQVQPAEHGLVISRPTGRRLARSQSRRWSTLPPAILKPPRMTWVVQHSNAQPVCFADAIDIPETATSL